MTGSFYGRIAYAGVLLVAAVTVPHGSLVARERPSRAEQRLPARAILFEENRGQSGDDVRYLWRGSNSAMYLRTGEIVLASRPAAATGGSAVLVRSQFVGARRDVSITGDVQSPQITHYIRTDAILGVPNFERVRYEGLYEGVDLIVYGKDRDLEYDFVVHPGASLAAIRMRLVGADRVRVDADGDLVVNAGTVVLRHRRPFMYQNVSGRQVTVRGAFVIDRDGDVTFTAGPHDATRTLYIDPVLAFSTYVGGPAYDSAAGIAVDRLGNAYVAGLTYMDAFPGTDHGVQPYRGGGQTDAYVARLTKDGSAIDVATYIGGSGDDFARDLAIGPDGSVYVAGITTSPDFPVRHAPQASPTRPFTWDVFVARLSPDLSQLAYATYVGGDAEDTFGDIAVDARGNAYVTGTTESSDLPIVNAMQPTRAGSYDAFVVAIPPGGERFVYATFYGSRGFDRGGAIAVSADGSAYVTGASDGALRTTRGSFQPGRRGRTDAFVLKLSPSGSLAYATYLGGSFEDSGAGIAVNSAGEAFVTGVTSSSDFPTSSAYQPARKGRSDGFISRLSATGSALVSSTYIGGTSWDVPARIALTPAGGACVAGETFSADFPLAAPLQAAFGGCTASSCVGGDGYDAFVSCVDAAGAALTFSSYLGGNERDSATDIAVDSAGAIYVTGQTISSNFPTTTGTVGERPLGQFDGFVTKIVDTARGDLSIAKSGAWIAASHLLRYTLDVHNTGAVADGVVLTDALPKGAELVSCAAGDGGVCRESAGTVTITYPRLAPDTTTPATLMVRPACSLADGAQVTNTAEVRSTSADRDVTNNRSAAVTRVTNAPPAVEQLRANPSTLWPPDHTMRDVAVSYSATDTCGPATCSIRVSTTDVGVPATDWEVVSNARVRLRAERSGQDPRTYLIDVTCRDAAGGTTSRSVPVVVPKSPSRSTLQAGVGPDSIVTADFNADRTLDLAVANRDSNSVSVFLGRGDGTFDTARVLATAAGPKSIRAADLNHDRIPDLITANMVGAAVTVLLGDGRGNFPARRDVPVRNACNGQCDMPATDVVVDDLNRDGHMDLAVAIVGSNVISVIPGRGDGSFGDAIDLAGFVRDDPLSLAAADFDHDGRIDLATANHDFISVSTLHGNGDGSFSSGMELATGSLSPSIAVADLNADGSSDLVVANHLVRFPTGTEFGRDSVSVLLGDGTGRFTIRSETTAGAGPTYVTAADFDGDGHADVAVANVTSNTVSLLFGNGDGAFARRLDVETGSGPSAIATGDFDGDSRMDLAVVNASAGTVSIISNEWAPSIGPRQLRPLADAYVRSGAWASNNFGAAPTLDAKKGLSPDNTRRSYLKFDVTGIGTFARATLRLYGRVSDTSTRSVRTTVYAVSDTAWNEKSIAWSSRPDLGAVLGALTVEGITPRWVEIDVTKFVRAQRASGRDIVTLALRSVDHTSAFASFSSREAATGSPQLVITP